ncbi:MAG TPA: hypothetical protein VGR22_10290 [Thermomicrobiales bacterium]|nr:hypothetical protein [Thermomicrobiales bacterium]
MAADGDHYYTQLSVNLHDDRNGIWRIPVKGGASELILPGSELADVPAPYIADVDPDCGVAVVYSYFLVGSFGPQIDRSLFWTLDLATGEKRPLEPEDMGDGSSDIPARVVAASYSPDGEEVVAWVSMPSGEYDLAVIDPLTEVAMDLALPVQQEPIPPVQPQWAANDTVMLPGATGSYLLTLERIDD